MVFCVFVILVFMVIEIGRLECLLVVSLEKIKLKIKLWGFGLGRDFVLEERDVELCRKIFDIFLVFLCV